MRKLKTIELKRKSIEEYKQSDKTKLVVVLDDVRSANNIGSVFRTSDAFLLEKIHLCGITATPPNKDIHKTALDSENSVEWEYFENSVDSISSLKEQGYTIIAIEQTDSSIMLDEFKIDKEAKYALILGNEVKGVNQKLIDLCDNCIEIPQLGIKHSLNVSVCGGMVIWEFFKAMK